MYLVGAKHFYYHRIVERPPKVMRVLPALPAKPKSASPDRELASYGNEGHHQEDETMTISEPDAPGMVQLAAICRTHDKHWVHPSRSYVGSGYRPLDASLRSYIRYEARLDR